MQNYSESSTSARDLKRSLADKGIAIRNGSKAAIKMPHPVRDGRIWPSTPERPAMSHYARLILCVDDEVIGLEIRRLLLERAGYVVLTAHNGLSGLELFSSQPIRAVVLDYMMPGMNGAEVASRMRQTKPEVPILLLTATISLPREVIALVDALMTKGEGAHSLLQTLRDLFDTNTAN